MPNPPQPPGAPKGHRLPPNLDLLTPREVAKILRISEVSVRRLIVAGEIPAVWPLPTKPRVPLLKLVEYVDAQLN